VVSTASAVGATLGTFFLLAAIVVGGLIVYYYHKRKREEIENDKLPLSKAHPANIRLTNGDLYRDSIRKSKHSNNFRDSKTPGTISRDVKINVDEDPGVRRENSIFLTMSSRGGSGMGPLETPLPESARGRSVVPVEEPEKVNDTIAESEVEADAILASTFLPISPDQRTDLNFTDDEIKEIERAAEREKEKNKDKEDEFDMDEIDDELGLPRLSRAFTPVYQPEEATLPAISYRKNEVITDTDDDLRPDGIKKVKVKKHTKKRVRSSKLKRVGSGSKQIRDMMQSETPFLERVKKVEAERADLEHRAKLEKEMKEIENEVIKARVSQGLDPPATNKSKR